MSTVKAKNLQVGSDGTASNNFTIYQPSTPDGTIRIGQGVSGATTSDIVTISSTGIKLASTAAPAFSAYAGSTQSISNASFTKVQCNTEEYDTNSNYDNATNYRFTPTVAGYYQISGSVAGAAAYAQLLASIYKNGSEFKRGSQAGSAGAYLYQANVSALIYFNGSTDYVELYAYQQSGGSGTINNGQALTYFQAFLARSA